MAVEIFKDVSAIHARLLDHRPVLQGHVNRFLKDFEDRPMEESLQKLKNMSNCLTELRDEVIPKCIEVCNSAVTDTNSQLKTSADICQKILEKEKKYSQAASMDPQQERRDQEWKDFMLSQYEKSAQIDQEFDAKSLELRNHYDNQHS